MSIRAMSRVWEHSRQSGGALLLLLAIADYAHDDGTGAYPSVAKLSEKSRMSERNVQYCLRRLERDGELAVRAGQGPHGASVYDLTLPDGGANIAPVRGATFAPVQNLRGAKRDTAGVQNLHAEGCNPLHPIRQLDPSIDPSITPVGDAPSGAPTPGTPAAMESATQDAAAGTVAPAKPVAVPKAEPRRRAATPQASAEGYEFVGLFCSETGDRFEGDRRRREALYADDLLRKAGGVDEAAAYVRWRIGTGQSPVLQFCARDYVPTWRQRVKGNGHAVNGGGHQQRGVPGEAAGAPRPRDERFERMLGPQREWAREHGLELNADGTIRRREDDVQPVPVGGGSG